MPPRLKSLYPENLDYFHTLQEHDDHDGFGLGAGSDTADSESDVKSDVERDSQPAAQPDEQHADSGEIPRITYYKSAMGELRVVGYLSQDSVPPNGPAGPVVNMSIPRTSVPSMSVPRMSVPRMWVPRRHKKRKMRSLVDLSIKTLAKNIEETSVEALEHLPIEILWRVYKYHAAKCKPSIRAWRLFCPVLARDRERLPVTLYSFWWQEKNPAAHDLTRYVELSTSPTVDYITHLTLHKVWMYNSADLMALADMPNLGVLELSDLFGKEQHDPVEVRPDEVTSVLNDRLVRGWSEKEGPFPVLRVLLITSVHSSITTLALQYVSRFPSLVYCTLRSTSLMEKDDVLEREVRKAGWRVERKLTPWREIKDHVIWHKRQHDRWDRTTRIKDFESCPRAGVFLSPSSSAAGSTGTETGHQSSLFDDFPAEDNAPFLIPRISVQPPPQPPWRLYSTLGEKSANADLVHQGVSLPRIAWTAATLDGAPPPELSLGEFKAERQEIALPPKPTLNVELGTPRDDYVDAHKDPVKYFPGDYDHALARRKTGNKFMEEITCSRDYSTTMTTPTPASSGSRKRRGEPGRYIWPRKKRDTSSNFNFETG